MCICYLVDTAMMYMTCHRTRSALLAANMALCAEVSQELELELDQCDLRVMRKQMLEPAAGRRFTVKVAAKCTRCGRPSVAPQHTCLTHRRAEVRFLGHIACMIDTVNLINASGASAQHMRRSAAH